LGFVVALDGGVGVGDPVRSLTDTAVLRHFPGSAFRFEFVGGLGDLLVVVPFPAALACAAGGLGVFLVLGTCGAGFSRVY
jgi:hypothetical protein